MRKDEASPQSTIMQYGSPTTDMSSAADKEADADAIEIIAAVNDFRRPLTVYWDASKERHVFVARHVDPRPTHLSPVGYLPPLYPEWLGDRSFLSAHGVRFPYVCGEMARGIATTAMVIAVGRAGMIGFFGAAGLELETVESAIRQIKASLGGKGAWGINLIHSPHTPGFEDALVDLYLRENVRRVSASAFMDLSPAVVRYAMTGVRRDARGGVIRPNQLFAKVSRPEVAQAFMSPPPDDLLRELVAGRRLTTEEAELASSLPVAEDILAEADSGGHTDNRPMSVLLPLLQDLRERLATLRPALRSVRIGAAGGLGDPAAVAAAFSAGAAFVGTGSVNQAAIESGLSPEGKRMLATAGMADVTMAPAADMFEIGVKVQVLRKGTMFAQRAARLYDVYRNHEFVESLPPSLTNQLERDIFRHSLSEIWKETTRYFERHDRTQLTVAAQNPKVKLALICRWYLGQSSHWAIIGKEGREMDFQIWCGPAQGAFNNWVKGSFLEPLENRSVVQIALNLLEGATVVTRTQQLRAMGVAMPNAAFRFAPRPLA